MNKNDASMPHPSITVGLDTGTLLLTSTEMSDAYILFWAEVNLFAKRIRQRRADRERLQRQTNALTQEQEAA